MVDRHILVLAAGKGTRMRSNRPKLLHHIAGRSLIDRVLRSAQALRPDTMTVVVGHEASAIQAALIHHPGIRFVHQERQLGTAHALLQSASIFEGIHGSLIVLSGDVPGIKIQTLSRLIETHETTGAVATILTAHLSNPYGYGRVIRKNGHFVQIVEETDATTEQRTGTEINSGIYVFDLELLFKTLALIPEAGPKHERYLPAILALYKKRHLRVEPVVAVNSHEIRGINSQIDLAEVGKMVRQNKNEELMEAGITFEDPATTYIDDDVKVGPGTIIHANVTLEGRTVIGARCEINSGVRVINSTVEDDVTIYNFCVITDSRLASGTRIGPFAHLRPGTVMEEGAQVGNFVELKQTNLGAGSKANHLSYIGNATLGREVNIGAGTITCNYDGNTKHETIIEDSVFVGSGTQLVAPVTIGQSAYVAAGSCVTDDVPAGALAITRGRQTNKPGWVKQKRQKREI